LLVGCFGFDSIATLSGCISDAVAPDQLLECVSVQRQGETTAVATAAAPLLWALRKAGVVVLCGLEAAPEAFHSLEGTAALLNRGSGAVPSPSKIESELSCWPFPFWTFQATSEKTPFVNLLEGLEGLDPHTKIVLVVQCNKC
jgi:hypothetical protein